MLEAFSSFGHYSRELFDDIADSITYANNYLATMRAPTDMVKESCMCMCMCELMYGSGCMCSCGVSYILLQPLVGQSPL